MWLRSMQAPTGLRARRHYEAPNRPAGRFGSLRPPLGYRQICRTSYVRSTRARVITCSPAAIEPSAAAYIAVASYSGGSHLRMMGSSMPRAQGTSAFRTASIIRGSASLVNCSILP